MRHPLLIPALAVCVSGFAAKTAKRPESAHACRPDDKSEFLIYASKAICIENLETMRANAP